MRWLVDDQRRQSSINNKNVSCSWEGGPLDRGDGAATRAGGVRLHRRGFRRLPRTRWIRGRRNLERKTEEVSGGERDTTNQRMELTAACVALETIDEGHVVTVYSDSSYLVNCMRRGWHERWRKNGWLNDLNGPVANRDLWERLLQATRRHREVRWKKVKGHQKGVGLHRAGNDRADELAVAAKKEAGGDRGSGLRSLPEGCEAARFAGEQARRSSHLLRY